MLLLMYSLLLSMFISSFVFFISWFMSKRGFKDREKSSPFECGFDPLGSARLPFSIRFFLLAVIFLIFDVELVLLMPFPLFGVFFYSNFGFLIVSMFLVVLLIGVFHEWREGSLDWV
uniref:NADH-ubiquinone oxidoreductase chain 3 n=1 Tax=Cephalothrix sp. BMK-2020 TaxID=2741703 RepID=A0A6M8U162_9BILA|nr:NADH dehydrogenase subunit 3 [Cephalothrix sp. BMK-2020]